MFVVLFAVASIGLTIANGLFLQISAGDPEYTPQDATGALLALGVVACALIYTILFILCIFLTCRVTYRMVSNLHKLNSTYADMSPGWAIGYYFIPFANLVMPLRGVEQIWKGTFAELTNDVPPSPKGAIGWWWGCWIAANILENIASRLSGQGLLSTSSSPLTPEAISVENGVEAIAEIFTLLACVFMLRLFGKLTKAQQGLAEITALS
ncbi:MAG: DUF4328 domain-containing protein [Alphaproteobacteria bacterium]